MNYHFLYNIFLRINKIFTYICCMASFVINNNTNSFVVTVGLNVNPFSRNDLRVGFSGSNDQILNIYDKSVNKTLLWSITLGVDTVDVDGVTVFADAQALYDEIEPIFFLDDGGGDQYDQQQSNPAA